MTAAAQRESVSVNVSIGQTMLTNSDLDHVELREELGEHTRCSISFTRDRATDLKLNTLVASPVVVSFRTQGGGVREFKGVVSAISQAAFGTGGSAFDLEVISHSVDLEYRRVEYFRNSTLPAVAKQLGVKVVGSGDNPTLDFIQYGESDFLFLKRIADEAGYFVRTAGEIPELHLKFVGPALELIAGQSLLEISVSANPANSGYKGAIYEAPSKTDSRLHGVRKPDPGWLGGSSELTGILSKMSARYAGGGDLEVEDFPARAPDVKAFRESLLQKSARVLGTSLAADGSSTLVTLTAGQMIKIASGDTMTLPADFLGNYGLTKVVHAWDGHQYVNRFSATPWTSFTHEAQPPRRLMPGPVTAFVVENNDPKRMGRIRVRFFWQDAGQVTRWMRIVTPHAGNERGFAFVPEIGDEVLVGFEQGDPERPFVLGSFWNGKDQTAAGPSDNSSKRIVTKSGNTLHFSDEQGKEVIELFSAKGTCYVRLSNDDQGKPLVTIRSGGDLSLEAEGEIRMKCESLTQRVAKDAGRFVGSNDVVKAGQNAVIKAGQNFAVEASTASVKASATLSMVAGATNNISGAMVQIQPPGLMVPPARAVEPPQKPTAWKSQNTPKSSKGTSNSQRPTPRNKG